MKAYTLASLLFIASCSPVNVQRWFVTTAPDGDLVHHYEGYTSLNETAPDSSRKYIDKALAEQCGGPAHVVRLDEWESRNAFGKFLYWAGEGQCTQKK